MNKIWSVGVFTRISLLQILKKGLHSSQIELNALIHSVINAWRVRMTLHISSPLITSLSFSDLGFPLTEKVYFAVKTCEDLWRPKEGLHVDKLLYYKALNHLCEEWRLFYDFHFFSASIPRNKPRSNNVISLLQPYGLCPASLLFTPYILMVFSLQTYALCPAFVLLSALKHITNV